MEDGVTQAKAVKNKGNIYYTNNCKYTLIFYTDDFVVLCETKEEAEKIKTLMSPYLIQRGLALSEEKTKVVSLKEGFNFLGFSIQTYLTKQGEKLYIKPSKETIKKAKSTISETFAMMQGSSATALVGKLNPKVRGGTTWVKKRKVK